MNRNSQHPLRPTLRHESHESAVAADRDLAVLVEKPYATAPRAQQKISIIVPMYNEAAHVLELYERLVATLTPLSETFEIICIDDGSDDQTYAMLAHLHSVDPRVRAYRLSRNFGKESAMSAGLDFCRGELVVILDADLQHPPESIPAMIARLDEGYDVVYAVRRSRSGQGFVRRVASDVFHSFMRRIASVEIGDGAGDFRVMRRKVVLALRRFRESHRYMKGLFAWSGFRSATVSFDQVPRVGGDSRWRFSALVVLAVEAITSFSAFPIRLVTFGGLLLGALTVVLATALSILGAGIGDLTNGKMLLLVVLSMSSLQLIALGVVGEYVARAYSEAKRRPLYLVRESLGRRRRRQ
ncbi:MAG: glycosyltransferase family 2 protein [Polyangiaceae bacterium]